MLSCFIDLTKNSVQMQSLKVRIRSRYILNCIQKSFLRFKTNSPYISGDSIARICDYVIPFPILDVDIVRKNIAKADSIFVNGHNLTEMLEGARDLLSGKIIFSGNSDQNFTDTKIFADLQSLVFCQNSTIISLNHVRTLPIGIENIRLGRSGFKRLHKGLSHFKYTNRVFVPPMSPTNLSRIEVVALAKTKPELFAVMTDYLPTKQYFKKARDYKFIFACEGNGFDTHRLWEILYQNSFPVVLRSDWSISLQWLELPILLVDSVTDITPSLLEEFLSRNENFNSELTPQLWIPFWKNLIHAKTKSEN